MLMSRSKIDQLKKIKEDALQEGGLDRFSFNLPGSWLPLILADLERLHDLEAGAMLAEADRKVAASASTKAEERLREIIAAAKAAEDAEDFIAWVISLDGGR